MSHPRQNGSIGFLAAGSFCAALLGCASDPVSLEVRPAALPAVTKIDRPVAFLHARAFREYVQPVEPYGNKYYLPLKAGEASDRALRSAYAQVFNAPREIASAAELPGLNGPQAPVALLEPAITGLEYVNASARMWGPFYAEVTYLFSLADAAGTPVASWRVRGIGEYDPATSRQEPPPRGETAMLVEAPRRAINAAAADFVRSFERVPELIRLARNLPLAGADVSAENQITRDTAPVSPGVEAAYPGAFALHVQGADLPRPAGQSNKNVPQEPYLLPVRLTLHNRGTHRLALDPADAEWLPQGSVQKAVSPLSAPAVSAFLAGHPFGLHVGVMSPGAGMLPGLFASMLNVAEIERQKKDYAEWAAAINRDLLAAGVAVAGASRGGVIYFARPPKLRGGTLTVPVIDLDDARRFTVRVTLPAN